MSKKRYMELLLEQIRNKRAKELVAHEITSHIEDQEEAYRAQGLTAYDAERRAVLDMGDPVETGVSLDAVHKPKMSWSMVILTVNDLPAWSVYDWNDMQGNFGFFNYFTVKKTDYLSDDRIWNHAFYL